MSSLGGIAVFTLIFWVTRGRNGSEKEVFGSNKAESHKQASNEILGIGTFTPQAIGDSFEGRPWITDLTIGDLDQDGLLDIVFCEGQQNKVIWLRQTSVGNYDEILLTSDIAGPAHVEIFDLDQDGDNDLLIAAMGKIMPTTKKIGSVVVLENRGNETFIKHVLLKDTSRVTDVQPGDFDGDGKIDLAVGQFGYSEGAIQWLHNQGNWNFKSNVLLRLSGTIHTPVVDVNGDQNLDIVALVSQEWEEIYIFDNEGRSFTQ